MSDTDTVTIKYTGKMGSTAETPWGILTKGDKVETDAKTARAAVRSGNYAYLGERINLPDTTPTPDPIEEVLSAGPMNAVEPDPKPKKGGRKRPVRR